MNTKDDVIQSVIRESVLQNEVQNEIHECVGSIVSIIKDEIKNIQNNKTFTNHGVLKTIATTLKDCMHTVKAVNITDNSIGEEAAGKVFDMFADLFSDKKTNSTDLTKLIINSEFPEEFQD